MKPSSSYPILTYDFLQLVGLPAYWPAGYQRWLRLVDRSRERIALIRHDDDDYDDDDDDDDVDLALGATKSLRPTGGREERDARTDLTSPPPRECQLAWSRATAARDGNNPENNGPRMCTRQRTRSGNDMTLCCSIHNWRLPTTVNHANTLHVLILKFYCFFV